MKRMLVAPVVALLSVVAFAGAALAQSPTPVPIDLPSAVPLTSGDVTSALTGFFSIGPVLGVIALVIALMLVPIVIRAFRSLGARR